MATRFRVAPSRPRNAESDAFTVRRRDAGDEEQKKALGYGPSSSDLTSRRPSMSDEEAADLMDSEHDNSPPVDEYMAKKMALGGEVRPQVVQPATIARPDKGFGAIIAKRKDEEPEMHDSITGAIRAQRLAKGGMVDEESNEMESADDETYDMQNEALLKEHYGDDLEDLTQPEDSNEHADPREKAKGRLAKIMRR